MVDQRLLAISAIVAAMALASCSGGAGSPAQPILSSGTIPTATPSATPTAKPTGTATASPTARPSATPTATAVPTATPTHAPTSSPTPTATPTAVAGACATPPPAVLPAAPLVFVETSPNTIDAFSIGTNDTFPQAFAIEGACTGLNDAALLALATNGTIYAANENNNTVSGFSAGSSGNVKPAIVVGGSNTGITTVIGIAIDSSDALYVANCGDCFSFSGKTPSINVFAPGANGNVAPRQTIAGPNTELQTPFSVAVDSAGNILVADYTAQAILIFSKTANGNVAPIGKISGPTTGMRDPFSVAVDGNNDIYVFDHLTYAITVYAAGVYGNVAPIRTIADVGDEVQQIGFDSANNVYVSLGSADVVSVYPPTGSGSNATEGGFLVQSGAGGLAVGR
jgi:hypothetical protein